MSYVCDACGYDLTPTSEQMTSLVKYGSAIRRAPCLKTENGRHVVGERQLYERLERVAAEFRAAQEDAMRTLGK